MAKRTYNRRGRQTAKTPVTSSKRRPQRIKGAQTARKTGSKDKMTISGQRSIKGGPRGAQGPANPPVQGPSRRTPTAIGGDTGRRGGANQPARSGPPRPKTPKTPGKFVKTAAKVGTILNPKTDLPAKAVAAGSLAIDAARALRGKPKPKKGTGKPMASMGSNYKEKERKLSRAAGAANFDAAFAKARRAGKKTFTWRGKKYNTKLKGE